MSEQTVIDEHIAWLDHEVGRAAKVFSYEEKDYAPELRHLYEVRKVRLLVLKEALEHARQARQREKSIP